MVVFLTGCPNELSKYRNLNFTDHYETSVRLTTNKIVDFLTYYGKYYDPGNPELVTASISAQKLLSADIGREKSPRKLVNNKPPTPCESDDDSFAEDDEFSEFEKFMGSFSSFFCNNFKSIEIVQNQVSSFHKEIIERQLDKYREASNRFTRISIIFNFIIL